MLNWRGIGAGPKWPAFLLICCCALLGGVIAFGATTPSDDEQIWRGFLDWLRAAPVSDNPASFISQYQSHLVSQGLPSGEVRRRMAAVLSLMRTRNDAWPAMFDKIYASSNPGFSIKPSALLVSAVEDRKPGRALDVGMGQGRNSVFLAMKGWDVTGFDLSEEGLRVARENASKAGVTVKTVKATDREFDFGSGQWDLIVITYGPVAILSEDIERLERSLRPGGLVVVESFASDSDAPVRKPVDLDPRELRSAFRSFRILRFEDTHGAPEWDDKPTRLVRMVAQKD